MTTAVATFLQDAWVKYAFTAEAMGTRPTGWAVALHTGDPTQAGSGNEVTTALDSAYIRQAVSWTRVVGVVSNAALVSFPIVVAGYTVTHVSVWGSATGDCLYVGALALPKPLAVGDTFSFPIGQLVLSVV